MKRTFRVLLFLAALSLAAGLPLAAYGQGCGVVGTPTTGAFPNDTISGQTFHLANSSSGGQNTPALYVAGDGGVARFDLTNPGNPVGVIYQLSSYSPYGGPVHVCGGDYAQFLTVAQGYEDSGVGRVVTDWMHQTCAGDGSAQLVTVGSGSPGTMGPGEQIDATGTGAGLPNSALMQVVKAGGSYYAYFADSNGNIYAVNVTTPVGNYHLPATAPLPGEPVLAWGHLKDLQAGTQTSTPYLFGTTFGYDGSGNIVSTIHVAQVSGTGYPQEVGLSNATYPGNGGLGVYYQSGQYWIFAVEQNTASQGIKIFQFNPANGNLTTNSGWFIPAPAGKIYRDIRVRGDVVPIVFALKGTAPNGPPWLGYDVIGTQFLTSGGSPTVATTIPYSTPQNTDVWEVYVKTVAGQSLAYLYVPLSGNQNPILQTTTADVSCAAVNCNQPPLASLSITNQSVQSNHPTDPTNYVGDTFLVKDTSASCDPPSLVQWDVNYNGTNFTGDSNSGFPTVSPWQFITILPCDPDRPGGVTLSTGNNCYDQTAPLPASPSNWTVANEATNSHGTSTIPGTQTVSLVEPLTKVKNFTSGVVQILSGQPIDASPTQGSPTTFAWWINPTCSPITTPADCPANTTVTADQYPAAPPSPNPPLTNNATFYVASTYPGGYQAPTIGGTVVVTAVIASFTYPGTVLFSSPFTVTNNCQVGPSATIQNIGYYMDLNATGGAGTYAPLPSTFLSPGHTVQLTAPPTAGSYYIHFEVDYTGTPAGPVYFDGPINVTDVVYNPIVSVSPSFFQGVNPQGDPMYAVNANSSLSFSDPNDLANPPVAAVWNFGDGSAPVTSTTNTIVHHTYSSAGTRNVTLSVNGITATGVLTVSPPICHVNCGGGGSCTVTISGPSTISPNVSGTWIASSIGSACSGTFTWSSSDGGSGSGSTFVHTFATAGTGWVKATLPAGYNKTDTVIVGSGGGGGGSFTLTISGPQTLGIAQSGTWTANVVGGSGTPVVSWLTSDNPFSPQSGATLTHSFNAAGSFTITCSASENGTNKTATVNVVVQGTPPPSALFTITGSTVSFNQFNGSLTAAAGDTLTFAAQETDPTVTFSWSYDGTTATDHTVQYAFMSPGAKTISLTATRPGSPPASASSTQTITITGQAFAGLVVPGAGHLEISDPSGNPIGAYATELSLVNNSSNPLTVDFDFEPNTTANLNPSQLTFNPSFRQTLAPHAGWYNSDVTSGYLGGTGIGTLFLKYSGSTQAPSAVTRIYFSSGSGAPTYGTYLPAYPVNASGQSLSAVSTSTQYLVALQFDGFSSGLTLVASSPAGGNYNINLFRDDATPVGATMSVTLAGYSQAKIPISTDCGTQPQCFTVSSTDAATHTFYAEVTPQNTAAATPVIGIASIVDDQTKDSMLVTDDTPRLPAPPPGSNSTLFVPGVGTITANGSNWKTDLYLLNPSLQAVSVTFTYFYTADGGPEQQAVAVQTLASGQELALRDTVATLFPTLTGSTILGQMRLDFQPGSDGAPLIVEGRIANDQPGGSYGMQLPAYATTDGVLPSSGQITLAGLHNDAGTRTNFGFTAMSSGSDPVTVHVDAYSDADGSALWSSDYTLNSGTFGHFLLQPTKGVAGLDALQNVSFSLVVTVTSGTGATPVAAFATVIDEQSSDPIFVPGKRPSQ